MLSPYMELGVNFKGSILYSESTACHIQYHLLVVEYMKGKRENLIQRVAFEK